MKTLLFGALLGVMATGCAEVGDEFDDSVVSIKGRTAALAAWGDSKEMFSGVDDEHHFADGFRAGFFNAVKYGQDHRPQIPRRYTGRAYQSRRGQHRLQAWIDGFAHGTVVAIEDPTPATEGGVATVAYEPPVGDSDTNHSGQSQVFDNDGASAEETGSATPEPNPGTE